MIGVLLAFPIIQGGGSLLITLIFPPNCGSGGFGACIGYMMMLAAAGPYMRLAVGIVGAIVVARRAPLVFASRFWCVPVLLLLPVAVDLNTHAAMSVALSPSDLARILKDRLLDTASWSILAVTLAFAILPERRAMPRLERSSWILAAIAMVVIVLSSPVLVSRLFGLALDPLWRARLAVRGLFFHATGINWTIVEVVALAAFVGALTAIGIGRVRAAAGSDGVAVR